MNEFYENVGAAFDAYAGHVAPGKVAFYRAAGIDTVMGDRAGALFTDVYSGERYYNCHCNGGVFNLGHRNPRVVAAVQDALGRFDIGNHHLVSGLRARLAERLAATTGGLLPGVVYGVAGGEAMDLAIKVSRGATGRTGIVSAMGGYHGHTGLALAAGDPQYRDPFGPNLPGFTQVPFDDRDALAGAVGADTAAVVLEPIPATLGMPIAEDGYFEFAADLCRNRGALLVLDEVQTGLGRTGRLWGYQHHSIEPDMLVTSKGLSGGVYPIAATLMTQDLLAFFAERPFVHVSTFGGAEPGCAAALAVLDVIEEPGFLERVDDLAGLFGAGVAGLPFDLRGRGLMMAFKFAEEGAGIEAARALGEAGVFCTWANNDTSALQFLPPLVLTDDEAEDIIARVRAVFA